MAILPFDTQPYRPKPGKFKSAKPDMNLGVRLEELLTRLGVEPAKIDDRRFDPFQLANMPQRIGAKNEMSNPMNGMQVPPGMQPPSTPLQSPTSALGSTQRPVHGSRYQGQLHTQGISAPNGIPTAAGPTRQAQLEVGTKPKRQTPLSIK